MRYIMQAKDSVTGAVFIWSNSTGAATGYTGPNAATELTQLAAIAGDGRPLGTAADGTTDDSSALQTLLSSSVFTALPDGARVYKASELDVNGLSVQGSGSTFKANATNAKVLKFDHEWSPNRGTLVENLLIDGNGFTGVTGIYSAGETDIQLRNIEISNCAKPLDLAGDIYLKAEDILVKLSTDYAVRLRNLDTDGGMIATSFDNCDFEQGAGVGLLAHDVSAAQGFGANTCRNTTWQGYQYCAHVVTAGEWTFSGYTQSEISALATSGWPYTTVSGHTIPERCVYYVGSGGLTGTSAPGATVKYESLVVLPPSGAVGVIADGKDYQIDVYRWNGIASSKCLNGGTIRVLGPIDMAGQDAQGLDLTSATPGFFLAASGGFSCWAMKPQIRQNQNLRNAFVIESSGNPWTPTATVGGTTNPTVTTVADAFFGNVTRVAFQASVGTTPGTNLVSIPVFANSNASGEYYAVSFLMRKQAGGASTIYCGSSIGQSLIGAHVVPTSSWERVVMTGRYIGDSADGRLYIFPQDSAGATIEITGVTSIRGTSPDDIIPALQGEVSVR